MPLAGLYPLKRDFKDMMRGDLPHGAKALLRVFAHPCGDLAEFGVCQAGIGLGKGDQFVAFPDGKGEIREQIGPPAGARLSPFLRPAR